MGSDFLFARPSFIGGMAKIFDFGGNLRVYNASPTPEMADAKAITEDWKALHSDFMAAIHKLEQAKR